MSESAAQGNTPSDGFALQVIAKPLGIADLLSYRMAVHFSRQLEQV